MSRRKKLLKIGAILLGLAFVGVWVAGEALIQRNNPPLRHAGVILSPAIDPLLKHACFDCHSNETRYPWYSYLPVASLRIARHVGQGRAEFSFSEWDTTEKDDKADTLEESLKAIRAGRMPPWDYRLMHPEARLTATDVRAIEEAVAAVHNAKLSGAADSHSGKPGSKREKR